MRSLNWLSLALAASFSVSGSALLTSKPSLAIESNGQVYFAHPPTLVNASTTRNTAAMSNPTYYFTLSVPEDAGEPLKRVDILPKDTNTAMRSIRYDTEETQAFLGTPRDRGDDVTLGTTEVNEDNQTVTVNFDQPVPPGSTVTIALKPERNPRLSGIYLFGVTAYPEGDSPYGQFLGYGRLQFYQQGDNFIFN